MIWLGIGIVVGAALFALIWKLSAPKKWQKANPSILDELSTHKRIKPLGRPLRKKYPVIVDEMHKYSDKVTARHTPNNGGYTRDDEVTYTAAASQATDSNPSGGGPDE